MWQTHSTLTCVRVWGFFVGFFGVAASLCYIKAHNHAILLSAPLTICLPLSQRWLRASLSAVAPWPWLLSDRPVGRVCERGMQQDWLWVNLRNLKNRRRPQEKERRGSSEPSCGCSCLMSPVTCCTTCLTNAHTWSYEHQNSSQRLFLLGNRVIIAHYETQYNSVSFITYTALLTTVTFLYITFYV